jgi:ParB family chromosome partitioning protein
MPTSPAIQTIAIADIDCRDRLRGIDPAQVEILVESIGRSGLHQPVIVRRVGGGDKPYQLVSGLQRIEAMRGLGRDQIDAIVRTISQLEAEIIEIDENLARRDLPVLDKARLIASRLQNWEAVHGYGHGGDRKSAAVKKSKSHRATLILSHKNSNIMTASQASKLDAALKSASADVAGTFSHITAEQVGMSRASIYRLLSIERRIDPEVAADLRDNAPAKFTNNAGQLYRLSRETPTLQRQIADMIIAGKASNVAGALRMLTNAPALAKPDKLTVALNAMMGLADDQLRTLLARAAGTIEARTGIKITGAAND